METKTSNKQLFIGIAVVGVGIIAGLGGFFGGVNYQKSHASSDASLTASTNTPGSFENGNGNSRTFRSGGPMGSGTMGTVTAISASSITVESSFTNESKTYAIVSTTQITKDDTIASYGDITTSSTVMVTPDSANTGNALRIVVDPDFGGSSSEPQSIQTN